MNRISGALEQLDAAAEQHTTENLGEIVRELRDSIGEMLGNIVAELDRLDADAGQRFREQFESFGPRLVGEDPWRPNPITQPGGPNPTPGSEARDREQWERDQAKGGRK
jgi:hypothetical protein